MKNKKLLLVPFVLTILFFVGMTGVEAQQVGSLTNSGVTPANSVLEVTSKAHVADIQSGVFVDPATAASLLIDAAKYEYNNPDQTTGVTEATSRIKSQYYYAAYTQIQNGSSVSEALTGSLSVINRERLNYRKGLNISTQVIIDGAIALVSQ